MPLDPHFGNYQPPVEGLASTPSGEPVDSIYGDTKFSQFPDGSIAIGDAQPLFSSEIDLNDHFQNLANVLPEDEVRRIGYEIKNAIEEDRQSQEQFFEALADAIRLLGLSLNTTLSREDLPFQGASAITSTALFESMLDMVATATSNLFPASGMVDCLINGESTTETQDKSYRKKAFFNVFLTQIAPEFKKESRRTIEWAIIAGSVYKKVFIDPVLQRPTSVFIRPEDFIVNSQYATHLSATRKTHIIKMSGKDLKLRMLSGRYRDSETVKPRNSYQDNDSAIEEALQETTGVDSQHYSIDWDLEYEVYESHVEYFIKGDPASEYDLPLPYIITIDKETGYVLSITRNWEKDDFLKKKIEYFVNYSFLPALEGEGYGLVHYAGKLAESATQIKRQLINTATYANFPGGVYAAGIRVENNNLRPSPGEFVPIQFAGGSLDQAIKPFPYKEPSPALFNLLTEIEDSIKKPSAMINQKVADMTPQAPMGSVLAMLENLQKVPNSILEGFHESFGQELMLLNKRLGQWLPPGKPYPFKVPGGDMVVMREDFDEDIRVVPISNPAMQSSTYRFMQSEIILNQARQGGDLHNLRYAYEYFYKNLGLSQEEITQLLPSPPDPPPPAFSGDPLTENTYLMTNKPIRATLPQEHDAHMSVHQLIMADPNATPEVKSATQAHIQEHQAQKFLVNMQAQLGIELPEDPTQIPFEVQNEIAIAAANIAQQQLEAMQAQAEPPVPPAMDPSVAAIEIEQIRTQQRRESDVNKVEIEKMKLALTESKLNTDAELTKMKLDQQRESELLKQDFEMEREQLRLEYARENELLKADLENKKIEIEHHKELLDQVMDHMNSQGLGQVDQ